jgi:hypothetical protein
VCTDIDAFDENANWTKDSVKQGYAGTDTFRMIGTDADLNDHWVEAKLSSEPPPLADWHRVTCVSLENRTGQVHVMSVIDDVPPITLHIPRVRIPSTSPPKTLALTSRRWARTTN